MVIIKAPTCPECGDDLWKHDRANQAKYCSTRCRTNFLKAVQREALNRLRDRHRAEYTAIMREVRNDRTV